MQRTKSGLRFSMLCALVVLTTGALVNPAQAASAPVAGIDAATVAAQLGDRSAGSYLDSDGRPVVTVTTEADAAVVRAAGLTAELVTYSGAELAEAVDMLDSSVRVPGTAWGIDPRANQVVVQVDGTVDNAELADIRSIVQPFGSAVTVEPVGGEFSTLIQGGDAILAGGGGRCTLGFNVQRPNGRQFFLTAGHCTNISANWYDAQGRFLGPRVGSNFPGQDNGLVRHDSNLPRPGTVFSCRTPWDHNIREARMPAVGQWVDRTGSTTCGVIGQVTMLNVRACYPQGCVDGMIQANICAKPGDSGGPMWNNPTAFGLTSGGRVDSRPCNADNPGGITFYEPVVRAQQAHNVKVY